MGGRNPPATALAQLLPPHGKRLLCHMQHPVPAEELLYQHTNAAVLLTILNKHCPLIQGVYFETVQINLQCVDGEMLHLGFSLNPGSFS